MVLTTEMVAILFCTFVSKPINGDAEWDSHNMQWLNPRSAIESNNDSGEDE